MLWVGVGWCLLVSEARLAAGSGFACWWVWFGCGLSGLGPKFVCESGIDLGKVSGRTGIASIQAVRMREQTHCPSPPHRKRSSMHIFGHCHPSPSSELDPEARSHQSTWNLEGGGPALDNFPFEGTTLPDFMLIGGQGTPLFSCGVYASTHWATSLAPLPRRMPGCMLGQLPTLWWFGLVVGRVSGKLTRTVSVSHVEDAMLCPFFFPPWKPGGLGHLETRRWLYSYVLSSKVPLLTSASLKPKG